jgi:hypothetical protein
LSAVMTSVRAESPTRPQYMCAGESSRVGMAAILHSLDLPNEWCSSEKDKVLP